METTDKSLILAHLRGDREAFGEIVRRYGPGVLGYLTKISGNRQYAEDLLQETFKRVHQKAHTFRGKRLKPWLFTIATRVAMNGLRRRNRRKMLSLNETFDCAGNGAAKPGPAVAMANNPEPVEQVLKTERKQQVRTAIARLPEKQRATLLLVYYQQLKYSEVAEVLGCSVGTVKTQMFRAVKKLAQDLPDVLESIQ